MSSAAVEGGGPRSSRSPCPRLRRRQERQTLVAMEKRRLGRLEHQSSVLIYGAAALSDVSQDVADRSIQEALDGGINHFDVAADYGDAELRLGPWMSADPRPDLPGDQDRSARPGVGLARDQRLAASGCRPTASTCCSCMRSATWASSTAATGPSGALEAAIRAQEEGLVGAVGITGHGHEAPATHLEALRRYPFATVLTPLNPVLWRDEAYRADYQALVDEVRRQDAGLMTIKTVSRRNWPEGAEHTHTTWYEPYDDQARITAAVSWVLSHDEVTGHPHRGRRRAAGHAARGRAEPHLPRRGRGQLAGDSDYSSPFIAMPF